MTTRKTPSETTSSIWSDIVLPSLGKEIPVLMEAKETRAHSVKGDSVPYLDNYNINGGMLLRNISMKQ